jgi:cytochrome c551/c552
MARRRDDMIEIIKSFRDFLEAFPPIVQILIPLAVMAGAALVFGALISVLMRSGSRFLKMTPAAVAAQSAFEKESFKRATTKGKPLSANSEPILISVVGFVIFFVLGALFLSQIPGPRPQVKEEPKTAGAVLPVSGNFDEIVAGFPAGNADSGQKLFTTKACVGCHSLEKGKRLVGPSFYGLLTTAGTRKPGTSAKAYVYESIVKPGAYVVDGYQDGQMPVTYAGQLTSQEMSDLLAWIERDNAQADP